MGNWIWRTESSHHDRGRPIYIQLWVSHVLSVLGKKTSQNLEQARKTELKLRGRKMPLCLSGRHLWRLKSKNWRYELFNVESVCRVLASMPHCSWFLPNAIFDYVHPYVHGFFGCFGQKPLPTSLTIEVCNHVQACCPARAYCSWNCCTQ